MIDSPATAVPPRLLGAYGSGSRLSRLGLCAIAIVFLLLRVPVMYRQPGGQDEDCYAVPGLTILQTGLPQLPHIPSRSPESVYYRADEVLFAEPPLYFYLQALFYAVLPDVYGTARLASGVAGLLMLLLMYKLSREAGGTEVASLGAAGLFSISRWFFFPAICARPDILCGVFGLASILCVFRWQRTQRTRELVLTGVCLGLGGLTHPFAIVYAFQMAAWVFWRSRGWQRVSRPGVMAIVALLVFSVWIPLILSHPEPFRVQILNQFSDGEGDSLWRRVVWPIPSLAYHSKALWEDIGPLQFLLVMAGLVGGTATCWKSTRSGVWTLCCLAWSSIFLIGVTVGTHHHVTGYWVFPMALVFVVTTCELSHGVLQAVAPGVRQRMALTVLTLVLTALFIPGSGLRTSVVVVRHWNNLNYDSSRFAQQLIRSLPADQTYVVDTQFVLDFIVSGRRTLLASTTPHYFQVEEFNFDYLIVSRHGVDTQIASQINDIHLLRTEGIESDMFACWALIYEARGRAGQKRALGE